MADNIQLQGIEFTIVGKSKTAEKGISKLTNTLNKLRDATKGGLGLHAVAKELNEIDKATSGKHKGLVTLSSSLSSIARSSRSIGKIKDNLTAISMLDFSNLNDASNKISQMASTGAFASGSSENGGSDNPLSNLPLTEYGSVLEEGGKVGAVMERITGAGFSLKSVLAKVGSGFKSATAAAGAFAAKLGSKAVSSFAAKLKGMVPDVKRFTSSIGRIAMYRFIRFILSSITKAFSEGVKNLNEYSKLMGTQFSKSLNSLATDALYLKNSLAAAVAPIINALAPAIDLLTDKIANLLNLFGKLSAALTGQSSYSKAVKSATKFGDATKGAGDDLRYLISGFDELNVFTKKNGSGSGADYGSMFEESEIGGSIKSFTDQVRGAFQTGDWDSLGSMIGEKFNDLFGMINWKGIGAKLGSGLKGVVRTLYSALNSADIKGFGASIADMFNNFFSSMDFTTFGRLLVKMFTSGVDFVIGFIRNADIAGIVQSLCDLVIGMLNELADWLGTGGNLSEFIFGVFHTVAEIIRNVDWSGLLNALAYVIGVVLFQLPSIILGIIAGITEDISAIFEGLGLDSIAGFFKGITDALRDAMNWLRENFVEPFVETVKELFGIHSPSTVFAGIGRDIVLGLKNGITNAWSTLTSSVSNLSTKFIDKVKDIFGIASPSKVFAEIGGYLDAGLAEGMTNGMQSLLQTASDVSGNITASLTPKLPNMPNTYSDSEETDEGSLLFISDLLESIYAYMRENGGQSKGNNTYKIVADGREIFQLVVDENNRAIQRTGASPIRV